MSTEPMNKQAEDEGGIGWGTVLGGGALAALLYGAYKMWQGSGTKPPPAAGQVPVKPVAQPDPYAESLNKRLTEHRTGTENAINAFKGGLVRDPAGGYIDPNTGALLGQGAVDKRIGNMWQMAQDKENSLIKQHAAEFAKPQSTGV